MFDGMPDQFYQFLAAATTTSRTTVATNNTATTAGSIQLPLSFSLHHHNYHGSFPSYSPPPPPQPPPPSFDPPYHLLHHSQFITRNNSQVSKDNETLNLQHDDNVIPRSLILPEIPWSNDEMLALFKIRSSMDNTWFPDFIWENVSRKLAELGFKRSAEKCKEKFEEETRSFNSSIISNNTNNTCSNKNNPSNNYRLFGELEELCNNNNTTNNNDSICHGGDDHHPLPRPPSPSPPPPPPPPPPLLASLTDQAKHPDSLLSQRNESLGGDNEDEDGENSQVGEDKEEKEELGDGEEGEDDTKNGDDDDDDDDDDNDNDDDDDNNVEEEHYVEDDDSEKTEESTKKVIKKRKREKKFEMFKGFCEQIVNKMMAQQEQLHCKILQDMVKRDEEKIAKEEAWKKQEIERLQKELEVRAHEQAIVGDRQAKILDCLNKFNSSPSSSNILDSQFLKETLENLNKVPNLITLSNSSILTHDNSISAQLPPTTSCTTTTTTHDHNNLSPLPNNTHQTCLEIPTSSSSENVALFSSIRLDNSKVSLPMSSPSMDRVSQNPNILSSHNDLSQIPSLVSSHNTSRLDHTSTNATDESDHPKHVRKDDTGKRWPRDEVLALINIRCSLFNNNGGNNDAPSDRESFSKAPLWERISQKMTELGYKRSAKRCKEKWENINKYFRKTKDLNKKRSIDSRTCPYFHQLSHLYNQGTLVGSSDRPVNQPGSPESHRSMTPSGPQGESSNPPNAGTTNNMNASQGVVQVPGFDFEF